VLSHQKLTMYVLAGAIVVALAAFGGWTYTQRQAAQASTAFDGAMRTFPKRPPAFRP